MTERRGFGLYVHWPFCQAKCPYCDFNSHVATFIDQSRWANAFEQEIARTAADAPDAVLTSIFFGGGTPSLMPADTVQRIITAARLAWRCANNLEVTLEANPTSVEASRFKAYQRAGVNRVSIGVQALNDADLARLGRLHSADEARAAVQFASCVFDRVSFDLIYARQDQSLEEWRVELEDALMTEPDHVSLYQLTIEDGTAFGDRFARGRLKGLPSEDLAAEMYELTQEVTKAHGLQAYEVSNHAKPGAESRHNLIYWRCHDWIGIGPGAHGRFSDGPYRIATETHLIPGKWLDAVENGSGEARRAVLTTEDEMTERLMMGLRTSEGVGLDEFPELQLKFNSLSDDGLLEIDAGRVSTSDHGRLVLNAVLRELLA